MNFIIHLDAQSVAVSDGSVYPRENAFAIVEHYTYHAFSKFRNEVSVIENGRGWSGQEWLRNNAHPERISGSFIYTI